MPDEEETKLVVYTIVVRVPRERPVTGWSVYAIQTKNDYHDDIVNWEAFEIDA